VRQDSARALIEWDSFDIDAGEQVRYEQPGRGSVALNRVVGGGGASRIDGAIKANGNVWIVNRDGVAFGPSARIDVGGLLATTSDIRDDDFMAGRDRFTIPGAPGAAVSNAGEITFSEAGLAALVGAHVENSGVIAGEVGTVLVGGRETLAVDLAGDGLFAFEFDAAALTGPDGASVVQTGEIVNPGGRVLVTAAGAAALVDNVVSVEGLIDVSGADGGSVEIAAPGGALTVSGEIRARGTARDGGAVSVSGGDIVVRETARIDASGAAAGGFAPIVGEEALAFFGAVDVSGGTGPGGFVDTSAPLLTVGSSASIDASSIDGAAGLWLIDPIDLTITAGAAAVGEIDAGLIVTALSGGTDVTIQTANGGSVAPPGVDPGNLPGADPGEAGDITVATPLTGIDTTGAPSAPTLTLDADGGVFVNAPITQTDGAQPVSVTILSGGGGGDGIVVDTGGVPAIAVGGTVSFTALDPVDDHQPAIGDAGDVSILSDVQASFILIEADEQTQIRVTGDFNSGDGGFSALAIDNDDTPLATQVFIAADNADEIENAALSTFTQLDLLLDAPVTIVSTADPSSANPEFIDLDTLVSGSDVDSLSVIVASVAAGPAVTLREVNQPAVSLNLNARDGGDAVLDFDAAVTLGDLILQTPNGGDVIVSALAAAPNADRTVTITAPEIGDGLQFSAGSNTPGMGQITLENSPILVSAREIDFSAQQGVQADASAPGPTITNGSGQIVIPDLSAFAAGATITSVGQITDAGSVAFGGPTTLEVLGGTPQGADIVLDGVEFPAAADTILRAGTNEAPGGAGSVVIDEPASGGFQLAEVFARQSVSIRAEGVGAFDAATVGGGFATATFTEGDYGGVADVAIAPDDGSDDTVLDIRDFGADTVTVEAENGSIDVANMDAAAGPASATLIAQNNVTFANSAFSTLAATATTGSVTGGVGAGAATFTAAVDVVVNGAFGSVGGSAGGDFSVNGSAGTFDAMAGQDLIAIGDLGTVRGTAGRDARINKNADVIFDTPLTLGPLTVTRDLDVDSIRSVVSGGAIVVGGVSAFTCVSGGDRCDVDLNDVANDFGGLVSIEAEDARIFDANDLALDTVDLVRDGDPTPDTTIDSIGQDDALQFRGERRPQRRRQRLRGVARGRGFSTRPRSGCRRARHA
jgi:filamentous hemagglutinin family protein